MASFISHTTIDCRNAYELSEWWKPVLGYVDIEGDPNEPGHEECMIRDPETGHQVLFIEVPDPVRGKNWHFDVRPRERGRDDEVEWLLEYGATAGRRPPRQVRARQGLGDPRRPGGQPVLHPPVEAELAAENG